MNNFKLGYNNIINLNLELNKDTFENQEDKKRQIAQKSPKSTYFPGYFIWRMANEIEKQVTALALLVDNSFNIGANSIEVALEKTSKGSNFILY